MEAVTALRQLVDVEEELSKLMVPPSLSEEKITNTYTASHGKI